MRRTGGRAGALVALAIVAGAACERDRLRALTMPLRVALFGRATIEDRVAEYGDGARARLRPYFSSALVAYPPAQVVLVVILSPVDFGTAALPPGAGGPRPSWIDDLYGEIRRALATLEPTRDTSRVGGNASM